MRIVCALSVVVAATLPVHADIILSATNLNDALKKMERLTQTLAKNRNAADAWFDLGVEADALTTLFNDEVAEHGSQEKALIDLGLKRTKEIGVAITYSSAKKKFFYDNDAFRRYLALQPRGAKAADASFKLIEGDFFQGDAADTARILEAVQRKRAFLEQFRAYAGAVEVHLMLSVDYRDLYRHYKTAGPVADANRYRDLTRQQLQLLMKRYPDMEQAEIARRMLARFDDELRVKP